MAATIDDVSTAAISLSLAHSDKTTVLTQLQEIFQWMKNKDFSRIDDSREILDLLTSLVQHPLIISFDDCHTVLMECISCLPLPSSCEDVETQQAVTSILTALKATITVVPSSPVTSCKQLPSDHHGSSHVDTVLSSLLAVISETNEQGLSQPERAASLLHNISENCTSLVWMTNAHSLFEQLIYGALKLHERSSSLAVCGISVLSANFVTTLSSYLSSSACRLESSAELLVALYKLNQPCFESKLFSLVSSTLKGQQQQLGGSVDTQRSVTSSQLPLVCAISPQLFHYALEYLKVVCAESNGNIAVQELTWSFIEQFRTALQELDRRHHIHSYYPNHLRPLVELLSQAPTPNGVVHVATHISNHLSSQLDKRLDVWFTLVQYSHWKHAALRFLGVSQTTPSHIAVTENQLGKCRDLLKYYEWDWVKPSDK